MKWSIGFVLFIKVTVQLQALYLDGWEKFATPKAWGGDKVKGKECLQ